MASPRCSLAQQQQSRAEHWVAWGRETAGDSFRDLFRGDASTAIQSNVIPVMLPMYKEEASELVASLTCIQKMAQVMKERHTVKVCIIQDGYQHASESAKRAFRAMFPPELYMNWEATLFGSADTGETLTCVLQAPDQIFLDTMCRQEMLGSDWTRVGEDLVGKTLDVTLVIKGDNRKKYNSRDIFFRGFSAHHNSEFVFCTDCGTLFARDCLQMLMKRISQERDCIAVTGRQRTMTKAQQADCATEGFKGYIMRTVQSYENEFSVFMINACFSVLGCIFAVRGPCGLFRLQPLLENTMEDDIQSPLDFYVKEAQSGEESEDMSAGNCTLAEDSILTYAALYLTRGSFKAREEPRAVFYTQSETSLGALVAQRRRWLNGTVAALLYAHKELSARILPCSHSSMRIFMVRSCIKLMLSLYTGIALMPALLINCLCYSLEYPLGEIGGGVWIFFAIVYSAAYIVFAVGHHSRAYDGRLFALCGVLNAFAIIIIVYGLVVQAITAIQWIQWAALVFLIVPVLMNLFIPDFAAITKLLDPRLAIIYFCFMPTMQGNFLTMSIARSFDISCGNDTREALKKKSEAIMLTQMVANLILVLLPLLLDDLSMHGINSGLVIILLVPQAVIWLFSAIHCLGWFLFSLGVILTGAIVFLRLMINGYVLQNIGMMIHDNAYFVTQIQTPILVLAVIAVPAALKSIYCCWFSMFLRCCRLGQRAVRTRDTHADPGKFDAKHGLSAAEALTECLA